MRNLVIVLVTVCTAAQVLAQSTVDSSRACFESGLQKAPDECLITVIMNDSTRVHGIFPILMNTPSALYLRPVVGQVVQGGVFVPYSRISSITYTKPSPIRYGVVLAALGAGAWAGAAIGVALAPQSRGFLDFPDITCGVIGGIIGGLAGAALGDQLSKGLKTTVTIRCP